MGVKHTQECGLAGSLRIRQSFCQQAALLVEGLFVNTGTR